MDQPAGSSIDVGHLLRRSGWFIASLVLFVLGMALNLTPCVYPLILVTVSIFLRQATGRSWHAIARAAAYVVGIAITYSALGVAAALTGRLLGEQMRNPLVLVAVAATLVVLALSEFGLYQIRLPAFLLRRSSGTLAAGMLGALCTGLVMGLVAAPCIGPVTVGLLLFVAEARSVWQGFWIFFVLALGLGAPYLVLALFSGQLKKLPKSGVWMVWVERLFGFVLLGLALYFVLPLLPRTVSHWAPSVLAVTAGLYLGWLERSTGGRAFLWVKRTTGIACMLIGIAAGLPRTGPEAAIAWQPFDPALVELAKKDGHPVILDFSADWCPACREMFRTTYTDARVVKAAELFVALKADLTDYPTPKDIQVTTEYHVSGIPTLIFLGPRGQEATRSVGYVGPDGFLRMARLVVGPERKEMHYHVRHALAIVSTARDPGFAGCKLARDPRPADP